MAVVELSDALIRETRPQPQLLFLWDTKVTGLGLKVTPTGNKIFIVQFRDGTRKIKRVTLGPAESFTTLDARQEALKITGQRPSMGPVNLVLVRYEDHHAYLHHLGETFTLVPLSSLSSWTK